MVFLDQAAVAQLLGYTSIGCWLCAQAPQVVKNWQLGSCDGLSLPFLINWLFGDLTNLIGCILTDQLPFQTYLATYFCIVDIALVSQFYYYRPKTKGHPSPSPRISPHTSLILPAPPPRVRSASQIPSSAQQPHFLPLGRPSSGPGRRRGQPPPPGGHHVHQAVLTDSPVTAFAPPGDSVGALYAAALDVARAAERVSLRRSNSGRRRTRHAVTMPAGGSEEALVDSFHSDMSLASQSTDEDARDLSHARMTQSMGALDPRGRTRERTADDLIPPGEHTDTVNNLPDILEVRTRRAQSRSRSRAGAPRGSGRRAAGVAFMSLGLLFWVGAPVQVHSDLGGGDGHVVSRQAVAPSSSSATGKAWQPSWPQHPLPHPEQHSYTRVSFGKPTQPGGGPDDEPFPGDDPHHEKPADIKELIGRISAWSCTTLYLTSRLPQIWKNFQRKSVAGLSIALFVFAFLGNVCYVFSIILLPAPEGEYSHYLLRALPYLLGSGGTLVFDLTIMIQSAIYGSARPATERDLRHRRSYSYGAVRRARRVHTEEIVGLPHERQPLLTSPARATTEPFTRPMPTRTASNASQGSGTGDGVWIRAEVTTGSPTRGS